MDVTNLKVDKVLEQIHAHAVFELKKPLMAENEQRIIDRYDRSLWVPIFFTVHVSPALKWSSKTDHLFVFIIKSVNAKCEYRENNRQNRWSLNSKYIYAY